MPPQRDANEIGDEQQSVPAKKVDDDMDDFDADADADVDGSDATAATAATGGSYWDAPKEKSLMNTILKKT